jgi:hypothetical protein
MRAIVGRLLLVVVALALVSFAPAAAKKKPPPAIRTEIRSHDVAVQEGKAYIGQTGGLIVLDLEKPDQPKQVGKLDLPASVLGVTLDGTRGLLAAGAHGLYLADFTDPKEPKLIVRHDLFGTVRHAVSLGSFAFIAEGRDGISVANLSIPERPLTIAKIPTRGEVVRLALVDELLATAESLAGVRLFDLVRITTPRQVAVLADAEGARDVLFMGELLIVATGRTGLSIYKISDPRTPQRVGQVPIEGSALGLARINERTLLVARGGAGFDLFDVDPSGALRKISSTKLPRAYAVVHAAVSGSTLVVAADTGIIATIDLSDLQRPVVLLPRERKMQVKGL